MQNFIAVLLVSLAFATAHPLLVQDEEGNQYLATPLLNRERRELDLGLPDKYKNPFPAGNPAKPAPIPQAPPKPIFEIKTPPPDYGKINGGGAFNNKQNGGASVKYQAPNGAMMGVGYGHARGWGHDVSLDASHPVYSNGRDTLSLGGGISKHYGGFVGPETTDRKVGISYSRTW